MCGSGTFLTEAALIAADAAPALDRDYFGFTGWRGHEAALWDALCAEARERRNARPVRRCIIGSDVDSESVRMSLANAAQAGVTEWLHVEKRDLTEVTRPPGPVGLVVANPPYGERIGAESGLQSLYSELGALLKQHFQGWQAAILTGNPPLARNLGIYAKRTHRFYNGTIECRLLRFDLNEASEQRPPEEVRADWSSRPGAQMFANRLRKNLQRLDPWAEKQGIECFRVYDADMPEYAFAHRFVRTGGPACVCAGVRAAQNRRSGKRAGATPRGLGRSAGSPGSAFAADPHPVRKAKRVRVSTRNAKTPMSAMWCTRGA